MLVLQATSAKMRRPGYEARPHPLLQHTCRTCGNTPQKSRTKQMEVAVVTFIVGKSNLMDAISFVLGEKTQNLRVRNLKVCVSYFVYVYYP